MTPMDEEAGGYKLEDPLEGEGCVELYQGHHPRVSGPFVIKVFPRERGEDAAAVDAFSAESVRVSILRHPHIAQVFDSGVLQSGQPFLAMERLQGRTLEDRLASGQSPASAFQILRVARGLTSALSAAHAIGIAHRQIRPDNIFVGDSADHYSGLIKVLDFGVSRLTWALNPPGPGVSLAARRYLAPEQARGQLEEMDERTDQYALAALLDRMLNGSAVRSHSLGQARRGGSLVDAVLHKALSRRPVDRFPSVALFFEAFEDASFTRILTPARDRMASSEAEIRPAMRTDAASPSGTAGRDLPSPRAAINREGPVTRQFFEDGEREEANHWEDSPLVREDDYVPDPDLAFRSFDRIPRRRGALALVLAMATTVAVGVLATHHGGRWSPPAWRDSSLGLALVLLGSGTPTEFPERKQIIVAPVTPPTIAAPPPIAASPAPSAVAAVAPLPVVAGTAIPVGSVPPAVVPPETPLAAEDDSPISDPRPVGPETRTTAQHRNSGSSPRQPGSSALHGYVWSPDQKRLVPSGTIATATSMRP